MLQSRIQCRLRGSISQAASEDRSRKCYDGPVTDVVEPLILDLLEWVDRRERTYEEVIEAWRTSCPRLPVWEDANERGLLMTGAGNGRVMVQVTEAGRVLLEQRQRQLRARG
jgi:hypothetical protein